MILYTETPCFAMVAMAFGEPIIFSPILTILLKNGSITQPTVLPCLMKPMMERLLLGDYFYVFGGQTVDKSNGLAGNKSNQIWIFDFQSREWTNAGKTAINISPYKTIQKDSLFYLIGQPSNSEGDLILDLWSNTAKRFDHTLISANTNKKAPAFFMGDTLYYTHEGTLHKSLAFRDVFVNQTGQDRLFLNEITLFWNISMLALAGLAIFMLAYGSVIWQRRKLPRQVKGGFGIILLSIHCLMKSSKSSVT